MEEWLPTREAMVYVGVRRPESLPMWTDRPPANPRRLPDARRKYTPVRIERRSGRKFYYRPDLDAYLAFQARLSERMVVLRLHKPIRICAECERPWPCEDYRNTGRRGGEHQARERLQALRRTPSGTGHQRYRDGLRWVN